MNVQMSGGASMTSKHAAAFFSQNGTFHKNVTPPSGGGGGGGGGGGSQVISRITVFPSFHGRLPFLSFLFFWSESSGLPDFFIYYILTLQQRDHVNWSCAHTTKRVINVG
jgi:hypothetical protein